MEVTLANNFLSDLGKCIFNTHPSSGVTYVDSDIRNTKLGISASKSSAADLERLQNDRLKFLYNPLTAYLNISS